ncbi:MAG: reverse transcriptase-like protein [Litorilinea sp.]
MNASLAEILEAIQALSPGQRRQLYRRLRTVGLLETDGPWADTHRLQTAPAVRRTRAGAVPTPKPPASRTSRTAAEATTAPENPTPGSHTAEDAAQASPAPSLRREPRTHAGDDDAGGMEEYRSSVRSKVIMGAPTGQSEQSLDVMAPVPGQAPEGAIGIIFDGGSRGNPGKGYGSYALDWPGLPQQLVRLRFGDRVTNNEAEYDTLISALEATIKKLEDSGASPQAAHLEIAGDSLLVINQVLGIWEVKNARMRTRCDRVKYLLNQFGHWHLQHHARENSVRTLGH